MPAYTGILMLVAKYTSIDQSSL